MRRSEHRRERSRSPTEGRKRNRSHSRSQTYSPSPTREVSSKRKERDSRRRSRSRSRDRNYSSRQNGGSGGGGSYSNRRYADGRDKPDPGPCLGVFGMSLHTSERDLKQLFGRYGEIESVQIVYDRFTGRSRGFGFVYFISTKDATKAKEHMTDAVIDGMKVRVDYSVTRGGGPHRHRAASKSPVRRSRSRSRSN